MCADISFGLADEKSYFSPDFNSSEEHDSNGSSLAVSPDGTWSEEMADGRLGAEGDGSPLMVFYVKQDAKFERETPSEYNTNSNEEDRRQTTITRTFRSL